MQLGLGLQIGTQYPGVTEPDVPFHPLQLEPKLWMNADHGVFTSGSRFNNNAFAARLSLADNADLSIGDIDFTLSLFVSLQSIGANRGIAWKGDGNTAAGHEWMLWYDHATLRFKFSVSNGTTATVVTADALGAPIVGRWYFIVVSHDAANNTIKIRIDDMHEDSAVHSVGSFDSDKPFEIFRANTTATYMAGRISTVKFWKRLLTSSEVTYLRGNEYGRSYTDLGEVGTDGVDLLTSLISDWPLNEQVSNNAEAANAIDYHSNNDLVSTTSVFSASGSVPYQVATDLIGANHMVSTYPSSQNGLTAIIGNHHPSVFESGNCLCCEGNFFSIPNGFTNLISGRQTWSISFFVEIGNKYNGDALISAFSISPSGNFSLSIYRKFVTWRVGTTAGGQLQFALTNHIPIPNSFIHVCLVKTAAGNNGKLYLDGVDMSTLGSPLGGALADTPTLAATDLRFSSSSTTGNFFGLKIFSDVVLDQSQVLELKAGGEATGAVKTADYVVNNSLMERKTSEGEQVQAWKSYEGNEIIFRTISGAAPIWNIVDGKRVMSFAQLPSSYPQELTTLQNIITENVGTLFIVCNLTTLNDRNAVLRRTQPDSVFSELRQFKLFVGYDDSTVIEAQKIASGTFTNRVRDTIPNVADQKMVLRFQNDGTVNRVFKNGVESTLEVDAGTNNGIWLGNYEGLEYTALGIGGGNLSGTQLDGNVRHVLYFPSILSDADAAKVEQWLAEDSGITL